MSSLKDEYVIPFTSLKLGKHNFKFEISDEFFESFEYSLVQSGKVKVDIDFEKKESMMIGSFTLIGEIKTTCNRCDDPIQLELNGDYRLVYAFGTEPSNDESLIIVYPEEFELDLSNTLLELITVSIPKKVIHEEGKCNKEMIELYNEYTINSNSNDDIEIQNDEEIDPRWSALKSLKKK